jgi:hypothetical protein
MAWRGLEDTTSLMALASLLALASQTSQPETLTAVAEEEADGAEVEARRRRTRETWWTPTWPPRFKPAWQNTTRRRAHNHNGNGGEGK